ncbi:cysteine-rich repeat secretory protein 38 [Phtheirospermum japonicum]|uniref:Cysteine-rich repeat secretory protein 38 n=1 Tax=Phtheirospermum japonicum TaxID=374723 RepID=A0A830C855_9LAMI|nr:cysteine-rich repeat secretory protein 38 [Phtheirospermum japonicum]
MNQDTELGYVCLSSFKAFTINYNQSRALVVIELISNAELDDGFRYASHTWYGDREEWAYGLALCRGDVSPDHCKSCVNKATQKLVYTHCPYNRAAIIWHDYCVFKYSDLDFFGKIDIHNNISSMNDRTWNLINSEEAVKNWLGSLTQTAIQSPKLFASGSMPLDDFGDLDTLHGVAQCSRDLSADDCKECLAVAVMTIAASHQGARFVYVSCNVRFETYDFLND